MVGIRQGVLLPYYASLGTPVCILYYARTGVQCMQCCPSAREEALGSDKKKPLGETEGEG